MTISASTQFDYYDLFIYLFEQVEVLATIKLMLTCYTHPYTHKELPYNFLKANSFLNRPFLFVHFVFPIQIMC